MNKKFNLAHLISIVFVAMTVTFSLTMAVSTEMFEERVSAVTQKEELYEKLSDIDTIVRENYYFAIDNTTLNDNLASGYVRGISDIESKYYTSSEMQTVQDVSQGKSFGLGLEIYKSRDHQGYMYIYKVYPGSPADIQGVTTGTFIKSIDGVSTAQMTIEVAQELLLATEPKTIELEIISEEEALVPIVSEEGVAEIQASPEAISEEDEEGISEDEEETTTALGVISLIHSVYDTQVMTSQKIGDYGYIDINMLTERTASDFEYALNNLISQSITGIVIDLRDNQSKEFDYAAEVADIMAKEGTIMSATYQSGETKVLYTSDETSTDLPVVVITNEETGYAAEMLTVILKDSNGAKTVGATTMGKGTIQSMFRLTDGSGVELTIASLVPTVSESYNGVGIKADYEKLYETEITYELPIEEDIQVQRSFEVLANLILQR